jgi:hypothetical protein
MAVTMGTIKDMDSIDWSAYYHHSNVNFSGKIKERDWQNLLNRSGELVREGRLRMAEQALRNILLDKAPSGYSRNSSTFSRTSGSSHRVFLKRPQADHSE